ncbi:TPA: hypothetical protein U0K61_001356 [Streptococcus suis]|nr:hypothetical protein [Streptococcus suis]
MKPEDEIGVGTIFNAENSRMRFLAFKEMREKIIIPALVLSLVGGAGILATLNQSSAPVSNTSKATTQVSSTDKSSLAKTKESSTEQSSATSTTDSNQSSAQSIASQSQCRIK